jgi:hypothetical protein
LEKRGRRAVAALQGVRAMSLQSWLRSFSVSDADVRAEIWRLGARHRGEPLKGALLELKNSDLDHDRDQLLRACVKKLRSR